MIVLRLALYFVIAVVVGYEMEIFVNNGRYQVVEKTSRTSDQKISYLLDTCTGKLVWISQF